jgi:hypothetical protein
MSSFTVLDDKYLNSNVNDLIVQCKWYKNIML